MSLIVAPFVGLVIAWLRKRYKLDAPTTPETAPEEGPKPAPVTATEKLDATRELIMELRTQRDRLQTELEEIDARHDAEMDAMRLRHQQEMAQIQQRVRMQDEYIRRIEGLVGGAPRRQEPPTDPV